jgi:hypothetical protein
MLFRQFIVFVGTWITNKVATLTLNNCILLFATARSVRQKGCGQHSAMKGEREGA